MTSGWKRILVVLVAVAWAVAGARGQEEPTHRQETPFDLIFKGGTAAEYADAVRQKSGAQIVIMPGCDRYRMPAVELRGVVAWNALSPLSFAEPIDPENPIGLTVQFGDVLVVAPEKPLRFSVAPRQLEAFSLAEVLESGQVEPDDVLTAVQTALEMDDRGDTGLRYHPETRLLIVRGSPDAIDAVQNVISGVMDSVSVMRHEARELEQARRDMERVRAALQAASERADLATKYAKRMEELAKQGSATEQEAQEARVEAIETQNERTELEAQLRLLSERVANARERQEKGGSEKR